MRAKRVGAERVGADHQIFGIPVLAERLALRTAVSW